MNLDGKRKTYSYFILGNSSSVDFLIVSTLFYVLSIGVVKYTYSAVVFWSTQSVTKRSKPKMKNMKMLPALPLEGLQAIYRREVYAYIHI